MEKPKKVKSVPLETSSPPLQLEYYYFPEVSSSAITDFDPDDYEGSGSLSLEIAEILIHGSPGEYTLYLMLKVGPKEQGSAPYKIDLTVTGSFTVKDDIPENQREALVIVTGSSMLYGMAREFIMTVTGRGPWPPIMLPAISFIPKKEVKKKRPIRAPKGSKPASRSQS